jgi:two-component system, OmpR family, sensor kinase
MGPDGKDTPAEATPNGPLQVEHLLGRIKDLEAQVAAREQLLYMAAHELRNPIHAIALQISTVYEMAATRGDRTMADRLHQADRALQWFLKRCSLLLDLSRMASGLQRLELGIVDMREVLRHVEDLYLPQAHLNQAPLQIECNGDLVGRWDALALEQALGNLMSNAIKFGAGSPVLITAEDTGAGVVKIQVADRGPGISMNDQEMMLNDFPEVMLNIDPRKAGFGGGLWLARNLIEAHGGYLEVYSAAGSGSTFTTYLPRTSPPIMPAH